MISGFFSLEVSGWTLLWQSSLCMLAGLVGSFLFRRQAARAHQVLMWGIVMSLLVPFLSIGVKHYGLGLLEAVPQKRSPVLPRSVPSMSPAGKPQADRATMESMMADVGPGITPETVSPSTLPAALPQNAAGQNLEAQPASGSVLQKIAWDRAILWAWGLASLILVLRLIRTFVLGMRLLHAAEPLENHKLTDILYRACAALGVRPHIDIRVSSSVQSPIIWCWRVRPILLIPTGTDHLTRSADWLGLFCHEIAHWKRRDHVVGLGSELTVCLLWWHPLLWWAKQRLLFLSEQACDDWVLASGQTGPDYAELLLKLLPEGRMAFVPTVVGKENTMKARIQRIIKQQVSSPRVGWGWALLALLVIGSVAIGTALAQRRPAPAPRPERQVQQEELRETMHYLETRLKMNQMEIQALERNGRGQGIKARILRDEMRRVREQLRELKSLGELEPPMSIAPHAGPARDLTDLARRRDELAKLAATLERELGDAYEHSPEQAKRHQETLAELHKQLQQVDERLGQDDPDRAAPDAGRQADQQAHVQNLREEREKLAQKVEHIEFQLQKLGQDDPDLQMALQRELDAMRKQLQQMSATLEDPAPAPRPMSRPSPEPGRSPDSLERIRELEAQAKHHARQLLELDEQDRGNSAAARALQKRLQEIRARLAQVKEEMKIRDGQKRDLALLKAKEEQGRIGEARSVLRHQILDTRTKLESLPKDREHEAQELKAHLDNLYERYTSLDRRLSVLDEERPNPRDTDMRMEISEDMSLSLRPPRLLPTAERRGAAVQDQLNGLHGRMDELTGQMQELRFLLQQILEREQKLPPTLHEFEELEVEPNLLPEPEPPADFDEPEDANPVADLFEASEESF